VSAVVDTLREWCTVLVNLLAGSGWWLVGLAIVLSFVIGVFVREGQP
jgi:hypothetical protein